MDSWTTLDRDGVRLACRHFGGDGQSVFLLHGLAGHAEEWAQTASWLTARYRVEALDARGHGHSERAPADVSLDAQVADAAFVIEHLGLRPVVLVGQSLGGVTALALAAERPDLVRGSCSWTRAHRAGPRRQSPPPSRSARHCAAGRCPFAPALQRLTSSPGGSEARLRRPPGRTASNSATAAGGLGSTPR